MANKIDVIEIKKIQQDDLYLNFNSSGSKDKLICDNELKIKKVKALNGLNLELYFFIMFKVSIAVFSKEKFLA